MFPNNEVCSHNNHPSSSSSAPNQQHFHGASGLISSPSQDHLDNPHQADDGAMPDDDCWSNIPPGEKKRRLNPDQVKALEKSFGSSAASGNKLDTDTKLRLARELGLHPRQVAVWFQNRRARWKTKKLEKDYDALRRQVDSLRADNDALKSQNRKLHSQLQLLALKGKDDDILPTTTGGPIIGDPANQFQLGSRELFTNNNNNNNVFGFNQTHQGFWPWPDQHHGFHF